LRGERGLRIERAPLKWARLGERFIGGKRVGLCRGFPECDEGGEVGGDDAVGTGVPGGVVSEEGGEVRIGDGAREFGAGDGGAGVVGAEDVGESIDLGEYGAVAGFGGDGVGGLDGEVHGGAEDEIVAEGEVLGGGGERLGGGGGEGGEGLGSGGGGGKSGGGEEGASERPIGHMRGS